ncbi:MAG: FAD-dependent oxidoreductase [Candidatus Electrothrix scaldis]|nr:MAG: FAD-dependent oxidoreductase [Candidatus Electrothrix sp. GW3-3]
MTMEYVIVGGSVAAASGLAAIRRNRPQAEIRVVTDEAIPFYYRPLIPYLLDGSRTADEILFAEQPMAGKETELVHDRCLRIDAQKQVIELQSGKELTYEKLLLAAGGVPIMPLHDLPGISSKGVFTLRSMDDALRIREYLPNCRNAIIIGGGLVGIKATEALNRVGFPSITVIEQQEQILPHRADQVAAKEIAARLRQNGVSLRTNETVAEIINAEGKVSAVRLKSGETIPADMVIVGIGVRPNTDFLAESGISMDYGVQVDSKMRTSVPNIYAAGDLVRFKDQATGEEAVSGLWSNAVHTGRVAGSSMSGGRSEMPPLLSVMNSTEISGLALVSAGRLDNPGDQFTLFAESKGENYRKLLFDKDRLVGLLFLGNVNKAGVYINLIRNRIPLGGRRDRAIREVMREIIQ